MTEYPDYTIREATPDDIPAVVEMGFSLHQSSNFSNLEFDADIAATHVRRLIDDDDCCLLIAVDSQRTIGLISGEIGQAMFGPESIATEDLFYVEPDMRGSKRGVSARLLRSFCFWAADKGAARITVSNAAGTDDSKFQWLLRTYGFHHAGSVMYVEIG